MNSIVFVSLLCLLLIAGGFAAPHPEAHGNDKANSEHRPAHPEKAHPSLAHQENKAPAPVHPEAAHDKHATVANGITPRHEQAHPVKPAHQEAAEPSAAHVEPVQQQKDAGLFQHVVQIDDEATIEESDEQSEEKAEPEATEEKSEPKVEAPKDAEPKAEKSKDAETKPAEAPKAPTKPREYDVEKVARMAARQVYSGIPGLDVEALMASGAKKEEPKAPPKPREFDIEKVANRAAYNVYDKLGLWKPAPVNIEWAKAKAQKTEQEQAEEKAPVADLKPKEILVN